MSLLTDVDIKKALGRDIVIEPFTEANLTAVGYDFSVGTFVFSLEDGLLNPENGHYRVAPRTTIQILTRESLWVSGRIAGTLHSRVLLATKGFSHISTTLDPGWYGPLLITMTNLSKSEILLSEGDTFFTLVFYRVRSPTRAVGRRFSFIRRILTEQRLKENTDGYVQRVAEIVGGGSAAQEFRKKVEEANRPMPKKILASLRAGDLLRVGELSFRALIVIAVVALISLQSYWDSIKHIFNNVPYDTAILVGQVMAVIGLVSLLVSSFDKS